jgi:GTP-binding protein EngB required for normal cell division
MEDIKGEFEKVGEYKMRKVEHVNILIIGRTRTGKSTIKSLLIDPTEPPNDLTLKSDTKGAKFQSFHLEEKHTVINIIDTPGLFERGNNEVDIRDNETILQTIAMCINMEITKFHVICFCVSLTSGINKEDITSLELLIDYLGKETSKNSCLVITHCESKTEKQRDKLRGELVQDLYFKKIAPFFELGILFSGSINRDDFNLGNESVYEQFFTISDYRAALIKLFLSVKEPLPIAQLRISPARNTADSETDKIAKIRQCQETIEKQTCIIAQLKADESNAQKQFGQLAENYRKSVLREQEAALEVKELEEHFNELSRHRRIPSSRTLKY